MQSLNAALVASIAIGWWTTRNGTDSYVLDSTVGSIALNKVSEGVMLPVVDLEDASDNIVSTDT